MKMTQGRLLTRRSLPEWSPLRQEPGAPINNATSRDYELLEFIYNNVPTSEHLGYCADRTFHLRNEDEVVTNHKNQREKKTNIIFFLINEEE
jgi:hypothetical protein